MALSKQAIDAITFALAQDSIDSGENRMLTLADMQDTFVELSPRTIAMHWGVDLSECETPEQIHNAVCNHLSLHDVLVGLGSKNRIVFWNY